MISIKKQFPEWESQLQELESDCHVKFPQIQERIAKLFVKFDQW